MTEKEIKEFKCPECKNTHKLSIQIINKENFLLENEEKQNTNSPCTYLNKSFPFNYEFGKSKPKDEIIWGALGNSNYYFLVNLQKKVEEDSQIPMDLNDWLGRCEKKLESLIKEINQAEQERDQGKNEVNRLQGLLNKVERVDKPQLQKEKQEAEAKWKVAENNYQTTLKELNEFNNNIKKLLGIPNQEKLATDWQTQLAKKLEKTSGSQNFSAIVPALKTFLTDHANSMENKVQSLERLKGIADNSNKMQAYNESQTELNGQIKGVKELIDQISNLKFEVNKPETDEKSQAKEEIQTKLDEISSIKLEEMSDEECLAWLAKFKEIKKWVFSGNKEQREAVLSRQSEIREIIDKLSLETRRKEWKKTIRDVLDDKDNEGEEWQVKLRSTDLIEIKHIDFAITLQKITSKEEIDDFGRKIIEEIVEQRQKHLNITILLKEGEKAIESKDVKKAEEVLAYLGFLQRLAEDMKEERKVFLSKIVQINKLKRSISSLIQTQQGQQAQIVQNTK